MRRNTKWRPPGTQMGTGALAILLGLLAARPTLAGAPQGEPFDYRLLLAFDRLTSFTDVTARGGVSVAHPLGSSVNPGSGDFLREGKYEFKSLATTSSNTMFFGSGAMVQGESVTARVRFPEAGTLYGVIVRTDMLNGDSNQGDDYGLTNNEFVVGYSQRLRKDLSVGAEVHVTDGYLSITSPGPFGILERDTNNLGIDGVFGALYSPDPHWTIGLMGGIGDTHARSHLNIFDPTVAPVPFGVAAESSILNTDVRLGVGYRPVEPLGIYADWQYRHVQSDALGTADVGRMFLGAEYFPVPYLALRAGTSIDTEPKSNLACGVGFYGFDPILLEFAYAYNNFPEVDQEFGRAQVVSLSLVVKF